MQRGRQILRGAWLGHAGFHASLKGGLGVVVLLLFYIIYRINDLQPDAMDPLRIGRLFKQDLSQLNYTEGHRAALGAMLAGMLLFSQVSWPSRSDKRPSNAQLMNYLSNILIAVLGICVAIWVGWNWLADEAKPGQTPAMYVIPVVSNFLVFVAVALALFLMFFLYFGVLVYRQRRRRKPD